MSSKFQCHIRFNWHLHLIYVCTTQSRYWNRILFLHCIVCSLIVPSGLSIIYICHLDLPCFYYVDFVDGCCPLVLFFWPLCCLYFFDLHILITSLISLNSSSPLQRPFLIEPSGLSYVYIRLSFAIVFLWCSPSALCIDLNIWQWTFQEPYIYLCLYFLEFLSFWFTKNKRLLIGSSVQFATLYNKWSASLSTSTT
jgi:hypothetical protein